MYLCQCEFTVEWLLLVYIIGEVVLDNIEKYTNVCKFVDKLSKTFKLQVVYKKHGERTCESYQLCENTFSHLCYIEVMFVRKRIENGSSNYLRKLNTIYFLNLTES